MIAMRCLFHVGRLMTSSGIEKENLKSAITFQIMVLPDC